MELKTLNTEMTLLDIARTPQSYPAEVKAAALSTIKQMKSQLRDIEIMISSNVISEMVLDSATKILFKDTQGDDHVLTLKSGTKVLNKNIKDAEQYVIEQGFPNLVETKVTPISWSACKELRKQGGEIQRVIDHLYVESDNKIEIK